MSAVEFPKRYRCVVSIAGVSDPVDLIEEAYGHEKKALESLISRRLDGAAPARRAKEIQVPVLLFHGDLDVNVPIEHSEAMQKALRRAKKEVQFVGYEGADHKIDMERQRIDMLQRIGEFLNQHLKREATSEP
jgi:dipeptidyl aminopeptidase/acylaminoacyl peptidase